LQQVPAVAQKLELFLSYIRTKPAVSISSVWDQISASIGYEKRADGDLEFHQPTEVDLRPRQSILFPFTVPEGK
jgi:hypothetical protein